MRNTYERTELKRLTYQFVCLTVLFQI